MGPGTGLTYVRKVLRGVAFRFDRKYVSIQNIRTPSVILHSTYSMEVELVPLGAVPLGMVSSTLLYGAGSDGEQTEASIY